MTQSNTPAGFNFNNFHEIRSHSSVLYNERLAILFYLLDMDHLALYRTKDVTGIYKVYSILKQIYNNVRMLLRYNEGARIQLNLDTVEKGVYTTDVAFLTIDKMLAYCEDNNYFNERSIRIIMYELDNLERMIKDLLQLFKYFVRPDFSQKPDVDIATEKYKSIADRLTVEELRELAGKRNRIDFDSLGSADRIDFNEEIEYNPEVDGPIENYGEEGKKVALNQGLMYDEQHNNRSDRDEYDGYEDEYDDLDNVDTTIGYGDLE